LVLLLITSSEGTDILINSSLHIQSLPKCCPLHTPSNSSECITCSTNNSYCCTNQPYTFMSTNSSPFCCAVGQECCGAGNCCQEDEVCCMGWSSTGTCCKSSMCNSDGSCKERNPISRTFLAILIALGAVTLCVCIGICVRLRRSRRRQQDAQRRLANVRAFLSQENYYVPPARVLSNNAIVAAVQEESRGIPPNYLDNFPIYAFEEQKVPREEIKEFTRGNSSESLLTEKAPLMLDNMDDQKMCIICFDPYMHQERIRLLPCMHRFHVNCIDQWLKKHTTCPLCKLDLITQQFQ